MDQETQAVIKFCLAKGYLTQSTLHALLTRYQELQKQGECNFFALLAQSLRWTQEQLQAVIKASLAADSTRQCQAPANQTTQVHQQSVADISKEDYLFAREIVFRGMLNIEVINHQLAEKYSTEEGKALSLSQYLLRKRLIDMDDFIKIRKDLSSNESLDSPLPGIELKIIYSKGLPQLQQTKNLQKIAKYEIIREIGRGGMGIVYAVQDKELDRIVALKTLFHNESEVDIERFQREARLAASLRHPNIITVYDTGVWQNIHYFTMDYVDGIAISDYVQNIKPNIEEIVTMMRDIASALSLAHSKNVIHRDLKPGNILVDTHGVAHLGDFGLARELKGEKQLTLSGAIIGTPAYMPPEQAIGNLKAVDKRSDIYSFGAVLYELLVGRPPLTGATLAQSIAAITEQDPIAPRKLVKGLDIELETICLKCLEKNPQRRYPNGKALLADLDRYLKGEVIQARPASFLYKTSKLFSRNKMVASLSALCLSIIMVIIYRHRSFCKKHGTEIITMGNETLSLEQEITKDILTILHVFSCRVYGLRKYKNEISKEIQNKVKEKG